MNAAKRAIARTKTFVADHKVAIAVVATAAVTLTAGLALNRRNIKDMNEFLDEHGLLEKFYTAPEDLI